MMEVPNSEYHMNIDKLRQQIEVVTSDLSGLNATAVASDDLTRYLVAQLQIAADNAVGCAMLAEADLAAPLAIVARSLLEGLFVTYWALVSDENARTVLLSFRNEQARILRNLLRKQRGMVRSKTTGENVTDELLAGPLFGDAKRRLVVFDVAKEDGLEKLYDVFYPFLSMLAHGTAVEILAAAAAGPELRQQEMMRGLIEAARSLLRCTRLIINNKIRLGRGTTRNELEAILRVAL
jgi:hypothetical protein